MFCDTLLPLLQNVVFEGDKLNQPRVGNVQPNNAPNRNVVQPNNPMWLKMSNQTLLIIILINQHDVDMELQEEQASCKQARRVPKWLIKSLIDNNAHLLFKVYVTQPQALSLKVQKLKFSGYLKLCTAQWKALYLT